MTDDRLVYSILEAAKLLRISRGSAYEAAKKGQIPTITVGRRKLVPAASLRRLLGVSEAA